MGKHGERSMTKLMLPGSSEKLRISDEFAECFDSGDGGARMTAFLVSPFGTKVWEVDVGQDGDGAFLGGRQWTGFVEAHGISVGWFLVLRHVGRGVLTVKAFDSTCFIKEFGQTITVPGLPAAQIETGRARKPQFIMPLLPNWMEKMPIPPEFLKRGYISDEELNRRMATFVTPFRDFWHIDLEKDGSNVFFAGVWSKFLEFQGIVEGEYLLIRYQGNMIFTMEVFRFTGCRRKLEKQNIGFQQTENSEGTNTSQETEQIEEENSSQKTGQEEEANLSNKKLGRAKKQMHARKLGRVKRQIRPTKMRNREKEAHISSRKRKRNEEQKMPKNSTNSPDRRRRVDEIQSPLSMRIKLTTYVLTHFLTCPRSFSHKLGFQENCKITLKSLASRSSWEVTYLVGKGLLSGGFKMFCRDMGLKEGDICTFNVMKRRLWSVDIERY